MNILWVTSEAVPFAKTGGLADVSGALPQALARRGHNVTVVMPYYPQVMGKLNLKFKDSAAPVGVPFGNTTEWMRLRSYTPEKNLTFHFIEYNRFFDRPRLYDWNGKEYDDNAQRFIFFSRAAMQTVLALGLKIDILHANDWHAALTCVYLKSHLYDSFENFRNTRSVLTIHNIGYQGRFAKENMFWTGLGWDYFNFTCLEYYDAINFMKGGIMTADMVNAVSPTYACEILSHEYSFGLEGALRNAASRGRLRGIINGIDDTEWNPQKDKLLPATFSAKDMRGKLECRRRLQAHFGLPVRDDVPLFVTISRLAAQKGLDVFADSLEQLLPYDDSQFIVIGSGDYMLEQHFQSLASRYPHKMAAYIGYAPNAVSHLAEAGADFFVMPSRYEPCGLNQMYSMRYGTLPIVRGTGGLIDTVTNFDYRQDTESTGFIFHDLYADSLAKTIRWSVDVMKNENALFNRMKINAMNRDFSWNNTAAHYEEMYLDAHR